MREQRCFGENQAVVGTQPLLLVAVQPAHESFGLAQVQSVISPLPWLADEGPVAVRPEEDQAETDIPEGFLHLRLKSITQRLRRFAARQPNSMSVPMALVVTSINSPTQFAPPGGCFDARSIRG